MSYTWLRFQTVPGLTQLHRFLWPLWRGFVTFFNDNFLHIRETLVEPNGSTDTSFSWASQFTILIVGVIGAIVWSALDRKRPNYIIGEYWLRVSIRYFIAYFALYYGIIKLFGLQMPLPSLSQLSTPLGDFSQTRIAWLSIGASPSYQFFSGVLETGAGLFLLFRRTQTMGLILSIAVFANIVAINFGYDAPVKIMSMHFFLLSVYLLSFDARRIIEFFFMQDPWDVSSRRGRWTQLGAKLVFVYLSIGVAVILSIKGYRSQHFVVNTRPIEQGTYDVTRFSLNGDSVSQRWNDLVLYGVTGSIKTTDTIFVHRYERAYFSFEVDSALQTLKIKRDYDDENALMSLHYDLPDTNTINLSGVLRSDSLFVVLKRSKKKFRLSEQEFHWVQESSQ
ncbi:MAG: hypothetical protein WDO15_17030 [Bacteroidota bacterium]